MKIEKMLYGMEAIVYDELPITNDSLRIRIVYNSKEIYGFEFAYKDYLKQLERHRINKSLNREYNY